MNDLDELLMEHDLLLSPLKRPEDYGANKQQLSQTKYQTGGANETPTQQIDLEEVMNEFGGSSPDIKQLKTALQASDHKDKNGSFDLESSDDLNRIISKYENMLSTDKSKGKILKE